MPEKEKNSYRILHALGSIALGLGKAMGSVIEAAADFVGSLGKIIMPGLLEGYKEQKEKLMTKKEKFNKEVKAQKLKLQAEREAKKQLGID